MPLISEMKRTWLTRCGVPVLITGRKEDGTLVGETLTAFPIKMRWNREGKKMPGGGTDPFDLIEEIET
jgi:hypothetical protein